MLREYAGVAEPALRRHQALRAGRRPDPAQARGPQPHRRAQDPQRARPGPAHQADGQDAGHRRDRRRSARRRHGHGLRVPRPRLRRLHGRGRHRAAGPQRRAHAAARRRGGRGEVRLAHPQGRHQRGDPRLGRHRRPHRLPVRHGRGAAPVPVDGARLLPRHRRRGAGPVPRADRRAARRRRSPASAAAPTRSGCSPAFIDDPTVRLVGFEAGGDGVETERHAATICAGEFGVLHGARTFVLQDEDGQTMRVALDLRRASTTPASGPSTPTSPRPAGRRTARSPTPSAMDAFALLSRTEGIIPAIESAHAVAGALSWPRSCPARRSW